MRVMGNHIWAIIELNSVKIVYFKACIVILFHCIARYEQVLEEDMKKTQMNRRLPKHKSSLIKNQVQTGP